MKNLLIASALISLTGCSSIPGLVQVDAQPVERPPLVLPVPDTITTKPVEWIIVTPDNAEEVFKDLQSSNTNVVLFAVTDEGYENLSLNIAELMKLVKQQKAIIAAYKNYYETEN